MPRELQPEIIADIKKTIERTQWRLEEVLVQFGIKKSTYYGWVNFNLNASVIQTKRPIKNIQSATKHEMNLVIEYRKRYPELGYRKLTYQMMDENVAFLAESTVYQILSERNMLGYWNQVNHPDTKKEYTHKPKAPHEHWHIDIAYIKIAGIFYFLIMMLDGYSRFLLEWDLMTDMLGSSVEIFVQKVKEKYPHAKPKMISDNGSQFVSHEFKRLVSRLEIQQVFTRRNHPQTYQDAYELLNRYSYEYNYQRLHAGIKYVRPSDQFFGRAEEIIKIRKLKTNDAKIKRRHYNEQILGQSVH